MRKVLVGFGLALWCGCAAAPSGDERGSSAPIDGKPKEALRALEAETGASWQLVPHQVHGTPAALSGRTAKLFQDPDQAFGATVSFLEKHRGVYGMRSPAQELRSVRERGDNLRMRHLRMQQTVRGVDVFGAELFAHYDAQGRLVELAGNYQKDLDQVDVNPTLALAAAKDKAQADLLTLAHAHADAPVRVGEEQLVVYSGLNENKIAPRAAWKLALRQDTLPPVVMHYFVDAHTGAVLGKHSGVATLAATGKGNKGDTRTFEVSQQNGGYAMVDVSRGQGISTYDGQNQENPTPTTLITSTQLTGGWDTASTTGPGSGVDAHANAILIYDFFKTKYARKGLDGKDGPMKSIVHMGNNVINAFAADGVMYYGDGDPSQGATPFAASLEIAAHEFTHNVTQAESALVYKDTSGALNEALSDIFGALVEFDKTKDLKKTEESGEDVVNNPQMPNRHFSDPAKGQQPAHLSQYVRTQQDQGGVHINSGIVNNAFWLMTNGGTNPKSNVKVAFGLGWDKAGQVWYRASTEYLGAQSDFAAAAAATSRAAKDLNFTQNEQNIIECAWLATGVLQGAPCQTLTDPTITTRPTDPTTQTPGTTQTEEEEAAAEDPADEEETTPTRTTKKRTTQPQNSGCSTSPGSSPVNAWPVLLGAALVLRRRRPNK
jgi:bacillolysin